MEVDMVRSLVLLALTAACAAEETPPTAPDATPSETLVDDTTKPQRSENAGPPSREGSFIPVAKPESPYVFKGLTGEWGGVFIENGVAYDGNITVDDRIYLDSPSSAGWYSSTIESKSLPPGGAVYETDTMTVTIEEGGCQDARLRADLSDTVFVDWDGSRHEACGGWRKPATDIAGTTWMVTRINGESSPMTNPPAATLTFAQDGRLGGTFNCNDGGLEGTWSDETFEIKSRDIEQTAMGCPDSPNSAMAETFWSNLPNATGWTRDGDEMIIQFKDGATATLQRLL